MQFSIMVRWRSTSRVPAMELPRSDCPVQTGTTPTHDCCWPAADKLRVFEESSGRRSRPIWNWALNKRQALYVCAAAETPVAAEVAVRVLDAFERTAEIAPEETMEGQAVPASELLHPALLLRIERRARKLCEESVPRPRAELIRDVVRDLAGARPLDIENAVFRVSTLHRFRPESEEEATHLIGQWAWEIVPDTKNVSLRERIRAALTELLRGNEKPPVA